MHLQSDDAQYGKENASELLIRSTEQYAAVVAVSANKTEEEKVDEIVYQQSRQNIGMLS